MQHFVRFRDKLPGRLPPADLAAEDMAARATRFADTLEDLGPTFIKLGQFLASRPDLLPPEFQQALRRLQDRVKPFPMDQVRQTVERELKKPLEQLFKTFDQTPFACGSIAQAHYATTADDGEVVVKVQRPGLDRLVTDDINLLRLLAGLIERHLPEYRLYRPEMLVDEFARTLKLELDFLNEASVTARFQEEFAADPRIQVPAVDWHLSSHGLLTLQRLHGLTVSPDLDFQAAGVDRKLAARNLLDVFFRQFFELGIFHADPHPGNLLLQPPGNWGILDFGQVGRIDAEMRSKMAMCITACSNREFELAIDIFDDLTGLPDDIDRARLKSDLANMVDRYFGTPIQQIHIGRLFEEIVVLAREYRVILPRDFVLLGKSLATIGGVALMLDPDCAPAEIIRPKLHRLLAETLSPRRAVRALGANLYHLAALLQNGPRTLRHLLRSLTRGEMKIIFHHAGLENLIYELDRSTNRIAFSVITAAIILSSAILLHAKVGPTVFASQISLLGLVGFLLAAFFGVWLIISIFRSGRL
jgi:ubiquinone biosynthesis protein